MIPSSLTRPWRRGPRSPSPGPLRPRPRSWRLLLRRTRRLALGLGPSNLGHHPGDLLGTHDGDLGRGPQEGEAIVKGPARHAVGSRAVGRADDERDVRDGRVGHRVEHLGALLDDALGLGVLPNHVAGDVLEEHQWHVDLVAELDELRGLLRRLRVDDPVVGEDADGIPVHARPAADDRACRSAS